MKTAILFFGSHLKCPHFVDIECSCSWSTDPRRINSLNLNMNKILSSAQVLVRGTHTHTYIHFTQTDRETYGIPKSIYSYSMALKKCKYVKSSRSIATITMFSTLWYLCKRVILIKMLSIQGTANHPNDGNYSEPPKHRASSDNGQYSTWYSYNSPYFQFVLLLSFHSVLLSLPLFLSPLTLLIPSLLSLGQILFPTNHVVTFLFSTLFCVHVKDGLASRKLTENMYLCQSMHIANLAGAVR